MYECKSCGNSFSSHAALRSHTRWKHGPRINHECSICKAVFRDSFGVKRHVKHVHSASHVEHTTSCPLCNLSATKNIIKAHFHDVHNITLLEETLTFGSFDEFNNWKKSMELETRSKFVKHRATRKLKGGVSTSIYYCYRDGQFKSQGKGLRALKRIGSIKMNAYCPASLKVRETSDCITVLFKKTHVGHDNDFGKSDDAVSEESAVEDSSNHLVLEDLHIDHKNNIKPAVSEDEQVTIVSDINKHLAIVIEVPDMSSEEEKFMKRKQEEFEKLVEVLDSIKTNEGLTAFQQYIAPLKSIVEDAEKRWSSLLSVDVLDGETVENTLNKDDSVERGVIASKINIVDTYLLPVPTTSNQMQFSAEIVIQNNTEQLVLSDESHI